MMLAQQCVALALTATEAVVECQDYVRDWTPGPAFGAYYATGERHRYTWPTSNGLVVRDGEETWMFLDGRWFNSSWQERKR